jgi:methyl-accepting chemotaxis protein
MEFAHPRAAFRVFNALTFQAALLFLITILPVLLVVGWLNHEYVRSTLEAQINLDSRTRTAEIEQTFANVLLREMERLRALGGAPELIPMVSASPSRAARDSAQQAYETALTTDGVRNQYVTNAAGEILKGFREAYPNRAVVLLADPAGGLESVTTPLWPYWDVAKQPWWPDLARKRNTALTISQPMTVPGLGELLFLAAPVLDASGQPLGVVAVGLRFAALTDPILAADHTTEVGATVPTEILAARDGHVLYSSAGLASLQLPASWAPALLAVGPGTSLFDTDLIGYAPLQVSEGYSLDDISSIRTVNSLNWTVLRVLPSGEAFAPIDAQLQLLIVGTAATALVVVLMALVVLSWLVTRPLRHIQATIADVDGHGLAPAVLARAQTRLPHGRNEMGQLGERFGGMLARLVVLTQEREQIYARQGTTVTGLRAAAARLSSAAAEQQSAATSTSTMLRQVLGAFQALDAAAATIASHARAVADQATTLKVQHEAGEGAVLTTQQVLAEMQQTAQFLEEGALQLAHDANATGTLIETANEVAGTTHLLSLNASIEAAGAGAHGARFGIIAAEVRDLAAAAGQAATSIEQALARMAEQTNAAALQTHQARVAADNGSEQMTVLTELMQRLLCSSDELAAAAARIHQHSEAQRSHSNEVHLVSTQLANAMQQVLSASDHIASQAQALLHLASDLDQDHQPAPVLELPANRVGLSEIPVSAF